VRVGADEGGGGPVLQPALHEDEHAEDDSDVPPEPISKKRKKKFRQKANKKAKNDGQGVDPGFFSGL
jgi:hypothetical protein